MMIQMKANYQKNQKKNHDDTNKNDKERESCENKNKLNN